MGSDNGFTIRITARLTDLFEGSDEPEVVYTVSGRAALVIALKRETLNVMRHLKNDPEFAGVKFHARLYQWMEGPGASKLPTMRDIVDSRRDYF